MLIIDVKKTDENSMAAVLAQLANIEALCLPDDAWGVEAISSLLEQFGVGLLLAIDGDDSGAIKGYCLYQIVFEVTEIHRIATHPAHSRQGVALGLIMDLITKMHQKNSENLLLEVRADNVPAIALYQKAGFSTIDTRKGYYRLPDGAVDALIMQYKLN